MIKKYDILLTYEIKNREIENLCLIKRELEKRGYSVGIRMQYEAFFKVPELVEAEVIVIPAYYRSRAKLYTASHMLYTKKIVNLRWEQVGTNEEDENHSPDALWAIKKWGYDAVHIAWGKHAEDKMVNDWGVPANHVKCTGHITLDFLRGKLRNYFDSRVTLFKKYDIPTDKRIHLFISSFAIGEIPDFVINSGEYTDQGSIVKETRESQARILEWFDKILSANKEDIIIYRPHPEEKNSLNLKELAKKQSRFLIISDESIKQWILTCDRIYTWVSTSIAEVFMAEKGCSILRPVLVSKKNDIHIYKNANFITTYEAFQEVFCKEEQSFDASEDILRENYYINEKKYSYEMVCDVIEEVYKNDSFLLKKSLVNPFIGLFNKERIKNVIKRIIAKSKVCNAIYDKNYFSGSRFRYLLDDVIYVREKFKKNFVTEREIENIISKIDMCLSEKGNG